MIRKTKRTYLTYLFVEIGMRLRSSASVSKPWTLLVVVVLSAGRMASAQSPEPSKSPLTNSSAPDGLPIQEEQKNLAERFGKLEELFLRMSELEGASNPTRASLLQQAAQLSKQLATLQRLNLAAELLAKGQLSRALQEQESTRENLQKLLELLQSENRQSRIREDRARIEALIKDVQRLEKLQRSLRGRTEAGQAKESAERDQADIEKQTAETDANLAEATGQEKETKEGNDAKNEAKPEDKDSETKSDSESKEKAAEDTKKDSSTEPEKRTDSPEGSSKEAENKESQGKDSQGKDSQGKQSDGKQSDGKESSKSPPSSSDSGSDSGKSSEQDPSSKSPPSKEDAARERLKSAQERMQRAQKKLQEDQRQEAVEEQWAAEEELRMAAEELERILVQLREEEIERSLADLESRVRRMLEMQNRILDQTKRILNAPNKLDARQTEVQASKLSIDERKVLLEGQKALLLLQDEGSSMAFPEAVQQMNSDIAWVADAFGQSKIDGLNVSTQEEIVLALEEMLESLTATQKKNEEKKKSQEGKPSGGGGQGEEEQPLVDALAELRLVKTLQLRINNRTTRLASDAGKTDDPNGDVENAGMRGQLQELAGRQDKIQGVLRDIILEQAKK